MTDLYKINTQKYIGNGLYMHDSSEWVKAVKEDYERTVLANPNKRYMLDPFKGYIEIKSK